MLVPPVDSTDHTIGPDDAPVTLVEFGDYECPFCAQAHPIVQELLSTFPGLRFVYRHFPLPRHPHAERAAEAAEAAAEQDCFWQLHDLLFTHQDRLDDASLARWAAEAGCDAELVADHLRQRAFRARVREHYQSAIASGCPGTPTFFVNGRRHEGEWDLETLGAAIARAAAP
jgi:protein-disulfide isomerase